MHKLNKYRKEGRKEERRILRIFTFKGFVTAYISKQENSVYVLKYTIKNLTSVSQILNVAIQNCHFHSYFKSEDHSSNSLPFSSEML